MRSNIDDKELQHIMKQVMKDIQKDFHDPLFWEKSDREVAVSYTHLRAHET